MAIITIDRTQLLDKLKAAGFSPEQAEAAIRALADRQGELALQPCRASMLTLIRADLTLLQWMMGIMMAGIFFLLIKRFC